MSAWWWACQDEGTLIRENANDDARPPKHDHPLQLVSPAIAAALRRSSELGSCLSPWVHDAYEDAILKLEQVSQELAAALRERERMREVLRAEHLPNTAPMEPSYYEHNTAMCEICALLAPAAPKEEEP